MPNTKKIFLAFAIFILPAILLAEKKPIVAGRQVAPDPGTFVSEVVYMSSCTCAQGTNISITTRPSLLKGVAVTTASAAGLLGVYDSSTTASVDSRMLYSTITTNAQDYWPFEVGASTGIMINKIDAACVTVVYLEK